MQKRVFLFDFDGTIVDTGESATSAYNTVAKKHGYPLITKENIRALRGKSALQNVRDFKIPLLKVPFLVRKVRSMMKEEMKELAPISGISDVLHTLKMQGHGMYIVSSNAKDIILRFLKKNHLDFFDGIYAVSNIFGKQTKIKSLIKKYRWSQNAVVYVGDEARDVDAAKKAGISVFAATWGFNDKTLLEQHAPDKILEKPEDLLVF